MTKRNYNKCIMDCVFVVDVVEDERDFTALGIPILKGKYGIDLWEEFGRMKDNGYVTCRITTVENFTRGRFEGYIHLVEVIPLKDD